MIPIYVLRRFQNSGDLVAMNEVLQAIPVPAILTIQACGCSPFLVYRLQRFQLRLRPTPHVTTVAIRRVGRQADLLTSDLVERCVRGFCVLVRNYASCRRHICAYHLRRCNERAPRGPRNGGSFFRLFVICFFWQVTVLAVGARGSLSLPRGLFGVRCKICCRSAFACSRQRFYRM